MSKAITIFALAFIGVFFIDQNIKSLFLGGYVWENSCITLSLVFNKGVAFSMFAFLGEGLKWVQVLLIGGMLGYLIHEQTLLRKYLPLFGILFGAGVSNLYDRFIHGGVVDYIFWHCGFEFNAIFNFADVMIDVAVALLILFEYINNKDVDAKTKNS